MKGAAFIVQRIIKIHAHMYTTHNVLNLFREVSGREVSGREAVEK